MTPFDNQFPRPPPARPAPRMMEGMMNGMMRPVVFGGVAAIVVFLVWPYIRGEMMGSIGQQQGYSDGGTYRGRGLGSPPLFDPLGMMSGDGDTVAPPSRRQGGGYGQWQDSQPEPRNVRRWRDCFDDGRSRRRCGPWHDGAPSPSDDWGRF